MQAPACRVRALGGGCRRLVIPSHGGRARTSSLEGLPLPVVHAAGKQKKNLSTCGTFTCGKLRTRPGKDLVLQVCVQRVPETTRGVKGTKQHHQHRTHRTPAVHAAQTLTLQKQIMRKAWCRINNGIFSSSSMEVTTVNIYSPVKFIVLMSVIQRGSSVLEDTQNCAIMLWH